MMKIKNILTIFAFLPLAAAGGGVPTLDVVEVVAGQDGLIGSADSATQGTVSARFRIE